MKSQRPKACQDLSKVTQGANEKAPLGIESRHEILLQHIHFVGCIHLDFIPKVKKISKLFISGKFHLWEIPVYQVPIAAKLPTTYLRCKTTTIICYCYYYLSWFGRMAGSAQWFCPTVIVRAGLELERKAFFTRMSGDWCQGYWPKHLHVASSLVLGFPTANVLKEEESIWTCINL